MQEITPILLPFAKEKVKANNQPLNIPRIDTKMQSEKWRLVLAKKYGKENLANRSDNQIWLIHQAEKEIAQCENCSGLPCQKRRNPLFVPKVNFDNTGGKNYGVDIRFVSCPYSAAQTQSAKIDRLQGLSKIPPQYVGKTFDDYDVDADNENAVEIANGLINDPTLGGAYLYGGIGTGKTFLAAIMAQEIIKRGRQVLFVKLPKISERLRSTYGRNQNNHTEGDYLRPLFEVPTLILDDIGIEKATGFICEKLNLIIDERYSAQLQTIITSNLPLKELQAVLNNPIDAKNFSMIGDRVVDRLQSMCIVAELTGRSRRR